jgi:hypothetical protein
MIDFGKTIYNLLSSASGVTGYTQAIYPLVIPENTALPAIVYKRYFDNEYTKDYFAGSNVTIELTVLTDSYVQGVDIADAVKLVFDGNRIKLVNGNEQYMEGAYLQSLTFETKLR